MPTFVIHGDTTPLAGAEFIETRDALARQMFVTVEPGAAKEAWIRAVSPETLAHVAGPLYQIDKGDDDAIVLRQVRMQWWPWSPARPASESLDEVLRAAFTDFYESVAAPNRGWFAEERDAVNRYVMGHLVPACNPGSVLHDPAQIGIQSAVKQPEGVGSRLSAPKDVVIWLAANGNCWGPDMLPVNAPLAVLEWKVDRPGKPDSDRAWLTAFAEQNPASLGYAVLLEFADSGVLRRLSVARCQGGAWADEWLVLAARET